MPHYSPTHLYYMITIHCNERCSKCTHWQRFDEGQIIGEEAIINAVKAVPTTQEL